jgi:hypothetical protein
VPFPYLRKPKPDVWGKLVKLHSGRQPQDRLFSRKAREYSALLGKATEEALQVRFTWHSLRRGGATTRAHLGQSPDFIRRFGCWVSERALTHYVFPWSDLPLRRWRSFEPHPPAPSSTQRATPKPDSKRSGVPARRAVHHMRGRGNGRPGL